MAQPVGAAAAGGSGMAHGLISAGQAGVGLLMLRKISNVSNSVGVLSGELGKVTAQVQELQGLSLKVGELQELVKDIQSLNSTDSKILRELMQVLREDLKNDATNPSSNQLGKIYVMQGAMLLALCCGCLYMKGITLSDFVDGTKRTMTTGLSRAMKYLGEKSAALTKKINHLTKKMESYGKLDEHDEVPTQLSKPPEYSDLLSTLLAEVLKEEGQDLDEEFLRKLDNYLKENPVAAKDFVSKSSSTRKKWLMKCVEN